MKNKVAKDSSAKQQIFVNITLALHSSPNIINKANKYLYLIAVS